MAACIDDAEVAGFVAGRLDDAGTRGVVAHIDACSECRQRIATAACLAPSSEQSKPELANGVRVGRFVVLRLIGRGGMGAVYAAHDRDLDRRVALKLVRPGAIGARLQERLLREAQAMARLRHPEVITVYEVGTHEDQVFIVMELVDGGTLRQWLKAEQRDWREIVTRFARAGDGLQAAHDVRLVHRDFKPDNVLVGRDGSQRVTDFGLARSAGDYEGPATPSPPTAPLDGSLTETGVLVGTPAYMAPEQLDGEALDGRADQFSFCAALYQALYGELPFEGENARALRAAIATRRVRPAPPISLVPARVRAVLLRGLSPRREERFASMAELVVLLRRQARGTRARPRRSLIALSLLLALGGGSAALLWARRATRASVSARSAPSLRRVTTTGDVLNVALARDGKRVAYTAGGTLYVRDLDSNVTRAIADHASGAPLTFAPDGTLYFFGAADGKQWYIPHDGGIAKEVPWRGLDASDFSSDGRLAILTKPWRHAVDIADSSGRVVEMIPIAGEYTSVWAARFSPDEDRIVATTQIGDRISLSLVARDSKTQVPLQFERLNSDAQWYGRDALLLGQRESDASGMDLWLQPLGRDRLHAAAKARLVIRGLEGSNLSVSRDGRLAAFLKYGHKALRAWTVSLDEAAASAVPRRVELGTGDACSASLSPDGTRIVASINDDKGARLVIMPFDGGKEQLVARTNACVHVSWSGDGTQLAWRDGVELVVISSAGGPERRLPLSMPSGDDDTVVWLDRTRVIYHVEGNQLWNIVALDSGKLTPLTLGQTGWSLYPVVSPDGKHVALLWNRSPRGVWLIDLADRRERFIGGNRRSLPLAFSPDGTELYVSESGVERNLQLARVPIGGGQARPWMTLPIAGAADCNFSRDTRRAVCTDDATQADVWLIENLAALVDATSRSNGG